MESLQGYVYSVVYYNEVNKYSIVRLKLDQKKDERIILVGYFVIPNKDELCRFYGEYVDHPTYGRQFKVESYEKILPSGKEAIVRYLASATFKGVGTATAAKIVDVLGENCLNIIKEDPSILDGIDIKQKLKDSIIRGLRVNDKLEEAIKLFVGHGINMKYLIKMDAVYGENLISIVLDNPYVLIKDIDGMGFKMVDKIAKSLGISSEDKRRLQALLVYVCKYVCFQKQDTYTTKKEIYLGAKKEIYNLEVEQFEEVYQSLLNSGELIEESINQVYPRDLYDAEVGIATYLKPYLRSKIGVIPSEIIDQEIDNVERSENITYSFEQRLAIHTCINSGISIITGGPGTGKTTVVNAIIKVYENLYPQDDITLCAPTGRASKRMSELTKKDATTIHRLLKWDLDSGRFEIDEANPLFGDFIIVDEFSMVDCQLFYNLLKGIHPYRRILLIGDDKQLPPVSPGDVLRDLLELKMLPVTELIQIHRQDSESGIIPLCYDVRNGKVNVENLQKHDSEFIECGGQEIRKLVLKIVQESVENGNGQNDIQVLAPMYDGAAGINSLNDILRDYFNPHSISKNEVSIGRNIYREGDKILQLKNQPNDDVYNGDIGILEEIDIDNDRVKLFVNFDGNIVSYTQGDFANIAHAYCISVHKSQGSEYNHVIMPIVPEHNIMLKRKLIYTGISRAKQKLTVLGNFKTLTGGVARVEQNVRKTSLKEKIRAELS